ncbi:FadR/GntR family transcriptional regulator [Cellulomonas biazotea]|jgi:DNA-binding FadR family transcriptional regulator|uniref:GntR family transcriptional regulator n=1 Tax=Cellulomonas biazotea TaxID=1709 RepID=A0A402DQG2_9CELL|nr:FCD domain-containing protein [Cellulomonas biazotea]GCE76331.1 GntR family transcriptional regulator [Cellulomonas biazotea]
MARRPGLIDTAVDALRSRISAGEWPVGSRIPPEPALVDLLGVGRNTVREAVQSLVHAGLLERRQGSGTYVLSTSEMAVTMGRHIAEARQRDVVEVRRALEVEAARLAARRRTATDASALLDARDARAVAYRAGDIDAMVVTDLDLHRVIVRTAANPVLASLYENLLDAIGENIRFNFVTDAHGHDSHDGLVEAIVAGDDERAVAETSGYLSTLLGEP